MTTKQWVGTLGVLGLALFCVYLLWPADAAPPELLAGHKPAALGADAQTAAISAAAPLSVAANDTAQREALAMREASGRGDLVVRLLYGDDRSPAAGVMVTAFRRNETPRNTSAPSVDSKRRRTDADGIARFPSMRAGRTGLIADRGHWYEKALVVAGKETEVEFVMPVGVTITGTVVSSLGVPVPDAEVELESTVVATTDMTGHFSVRGASPHYSIGARALGHGASKAQKILAHDGRAEVRLELAAIGGVVEGTALDADGKALANVRVEIGRYQGGQSWVGDDPPRPARPRTDAEGHFRAVGIALGEQILSARAPGFVPWKGTCQVVAETPAVVQIVFARGNTLRGKLRDADGHPTGDILITALAGGVDWDEVIAPDGSFEIAGLPDGEVELKVDAEGKGEVRERVQMLPGGAVTTCELALVCGLVAKGKVRDEAGRGVPNVNVRWMPSPQRMGYTFTDENGAFAIANVPEGSLTISVDGDEIDDAQFKDQNPRAGELDLRVQRRSPKTVYIAGLVLGPDDRPAVARAWASGGGSRSILEKTTDAAGYFEIGPVAPGVWHVNIETRSFPRVSFERRQLDANTRWDVGTVHLAVGGELEVAVVEGSAEGVGFSILDSGQRWFGMGVQQGKGTSEVLPVGSYRLFVGGKTQAAQSMPFEIRAGAATKLDVHLRAGVRQRFEIVLPAGAGPAAGESLSASLRVLRGPDRVANTWANRTEGKPCIAETCLEPGEYTVVAKVGEQEGSAAFTVGEREGELVRIVMPQPR